MQLVARTAEGDFEVGYLRTEGEIRGFLPAPAGITGLSLRAGRTLLLANIEPFVTRLDEPVDQHLVFDAMRVPLPLELPEIELSKVLVTVEFEGEGGTEHAVAEPTEILWLSSFGGYALDAESRVLTSPPLALTDHRITVTAFEADSLGGGARRIGSLAYRVTPGSDGAIVERADQD